MRRAILLGTIPLIAAVAGLDPMPVHGDPAPNFVLIFVDNLGNGDLACFNSREHRTPHCTPHIDRLADEGTRFTSFYVASGVCTPSRAALMTGCYPRRVNMHESGSGGLVLTPLDTKGLNPAETTIAEILQPAGYATAAFGKWHLGDQPQFLPTRQGFDAFFGIPYSDDMTRDKRPDRWPELPLLRDETVIEAPVDRDYLVRRTTTETIAFIERNRDRPFFAYIPHTMPGSTKQPFASSAFRGHSANGAYGDAVEELDWSTGEIVAALQRLGIDDRTLIVWASDNGAVRRNPPQGSCAPYRGWGYDTSEGAMRVPCIMRWPGHVPAGRTCDELCSTLDLLPTFAALAGASPPKQTIDGHNIAPIVLGQADATSPWDDDGFCYYYKGQLQAVRSGPWKLYLPLDKKLVSGAGKTITAPLALYDVRNDVSEEHELAAEQPDVVSRLMRMANRSREELGDLDSQGQNVPGRGQRPAGFVEHPIPLLPSSSDRARTLDGDWLRPRVISSFDHAELLTGAQRIVFQYQGLDEHAAGRSRQIDRHAVGHHLGNPVPLRDSRALVD
ncbi:MAG TPA: sulfatase [Pirellulales bacterium]|jgi:arylsulfatase A-like enzyme|nr:sulfatase [Pirellulales bacterium]